MKRKDILIRPAHKEDVYAIQTLRNMGWQDNYVNPETGVTEDLLSDLIVPLPPSQDNLDYNLKILKNPDNLLNNLIAEINDLIVGVIFYEIKPNGEAETGVFVDRHYRGNKIGSLLLEELIDRTTNTLYVDIFASNPSKGLYLKYGFVEVGPEFKVNLTQDAYLPAQKLILRRK